MICDFCSSPEVLWRYPARDFTIREPAELQALLGRLESVAEWLACAVCARLIEAGDRDALARRALETPAALGILSLTDEDPSIRADILRRARQMHDQFFVARKGPGEPWGARA